MTASADDEKEHGPEFLFILRSAPLNAAFIDFQAADSLFVLEGGKNIVFIIAQMMMVMQTISLRFHFNILGGIVLTWQLICLNSSSTKALSNFGFSPRHLSGNKVWT